MGRNTLVINCDIRETRVALIESGVIAELQIERAANRGTVGNIVLGRVTRVLPGMQAAFIDVGMERAAFLHVEDLIRPDDFETYLAGARQYDADDGWKKGEGGKRHSHATDEDDEAVSAPVHAKPEAPHREDEDEDEDEDEEAEEGEEADAAVEEEEEEEEEEEGGDEDLAPKDGEEEDESASEAESDGDDASTGSDEDWPEDDADDWGEDATEGPAAEEEPENEPSSEGAASTPGAAPEPGDDDLVFAEGAEAAAEDEEGEEVAALDGETPEGGDSSPQSSSSRRRRRRRRRRGGRDREPGQASAPEASAQPVEAPKPKNEKARPEPARKEEARKGQERPAREKAGRAEARRQGRGERVDRTERTERGDRNHRKTPTRVSRSVPITEVVKEGDKVIVQISKEPIGTKGARVTSHVSLPGRYVVYLPTVEHVGVSKRIGSSRERARLREVVEALKPPSGGVIVRTVAEGLTKKALKADLGYLYRVWEDVSRKLESAKAPSVLYTELDLVLKTARDLFTDEIESIVIDDKEQYKRLVRFVEMFMPARVKDVHFYQGEEPIFDAYGIEDEIARALSRKVQLPSGGYLIIDQAEALTAIDVNTGRYVGKGSKDLEETALKTNLEAVDEIAYQLRFRNIGGLVILDLIDMDMPHNRDKVWRALEQRLAKDKAKTTINRISELGLIEMTRKRTRESLMRMMHETCFYCDGTGQIQSKTTIAYEILRQIRRERHTLSGYSVVVNAHPAVVDLMMGEERPAVTEAERRYMRRIEFNPRREYHIEQFDLQGR
jgi:ribonuclease G